jgi:hypothetical protein
MTRPYFAFATLFASAVVTASTGHCAAMRSPLRLSWVEHPPVVSPSVRAYMACAYDPVSQKVVMFGGWDGLWLRDTWTYDGTTWTQVQSSISPGPRAGHGMAYDAVERVVVLFGGFDGTACHSDTWLWDGASSTWTQAAPDQPLLELTGAILFTDPANGHVDRFGGYNRLADECSQRTHQWNGSTWIPLHTSTSPSPRASSPVALDRAHHEVVIVGGYPSYVQDTWIWDGTNWTMLTPSASPQNLFDASAAFDPNLGHVISFGGGPAYASTWEWTSTDWLSLQPVVSPSARWDYAMAYDEALGSIVLFGGVTNGGGLFNETWWLAIQP